MYITINDLQKFTNQYPEDENSQQELFVGAAIDIVNNYLGYAPEEQQYDKYFNGTGTNEIYLNAKPITELLTVNIDGNNYPISNFRFEDNRLFFKNANQSFPRGNKNIEIAFSAGYQEVPNIIKLTALRIAGVLQTENNNNIGITSKSFQAEGTRTFVNTTNFDRYLLQIADYKVI